MPNSCNIPTHQNCCGCLRLRFGAFLVSLLAIVSGCFGLTAIVIYGLAEQNILSNFLKGQTDGSLRKFIIPTQVITSSLLMISGCLTLFGSIRRGKALLTWAVYTMVLMCQVVLVAVIRAPLSCFFTTYCIIKDVPAVFLALFYFLITIFLLSWFYFILIVYSFRREVGSGE